MFAKRKARGSLRKKRGSEDGATADDDETEVVRKAKVARSGLDFSTKKSEPNKGASTSGAAAAHQVAYTSDRAIQSKGDGGATRCIEIDTAADRDARALREKRLVAEKERLAAGGEAAPPAEGTYGGTNAYVDWRSGFRREQTTGGDKATGRHGPLRAAGNVRATAIFDYQPCICKDYKETGFCSYGDACKFLHDRSDYKSGWELERDWEEEQKKKLAKRMAKIEAGADPDASDASDDDDDAGSDSDEEELPFACFICRKPWVELNAPPVKTRCNHYFCETCALKRESKGKKRCAMCEQPTQGIFNGAPEIEAKFLKKARDTKEGEGDQQASPSGAKPEAVGQWTSV